MESLQEKFKKADEIVSLSERLLVAQEMGYKEGDWRQANAIKLKLISAIARYKGIAKRKSY